MISIKIEKDAAMFKTLLSAAVMIGIIYTWVKVQNFQNPELLKFKF